MELFVLGSFWLVALVLVEIVLLFVFMEYENGIGATISVLVFLACIQFLGNVDLITFASQHPWYTCGIVGSYFGLGIVMGCVKWYFYCHDIMREFKQFRDDWLEGQGVDPGSVPGDLKAEWKTHLDHWRKDYRNLPPKARKNVGRITRWMGFWPVVLIVSLFHDFLKRIWLEIYHALGRWLQKISDNIFRSVKDDIPE